MGTERIHPRWCTRSPHPALLIGVAIIGAIAGVLSTSDDAMRLSTDYVLPNLEGVPVRLLPVDSPVVLVFADARCPTCRLNGRDYAELGLKAEALGVAMRIIMSNDLLSTLQYVRLIQSDQRYVLRDTAGEYFRQLGVETVPRFLVATARGEIVVRTRGSFRYEDLVSVIRD